MPKLADLLTVLAVAGGLTCTASWPAMAADVQHQQTPSQDPAPSAQPAIDGVMAAFDAYPLVGIGDAHGLAQEQDFYAAIIRDPRFARQVGNVVVEFGGAAHQAIIDRYVNGEDVPFSELRKVWSDTVGFQPYPGYIGFMTFYAQVRATNLSLPPAQRIKVWLGEPPIDWSRVNTAAEWRSFVEQRDTHAADVILKNVLGKDRKALVIYGTTHFDRRNPRGVKLRTKPLPGSEAAVRKMLSDAGAGKVDPAIFSPGAYRGVLGIIGGLQSEVAAWGPVRSMRFVQAEVSGEVFEVEFAKETRIVRVLVDAQGRIDGFGRGFVQPGPWLVDLVEARRPNAFYVLAPYTGLVGRPCEEPIEQAMRDWPKPALANSVRGSVLPEIAKASGCELSSQILAADAMLYVGSGRELVTAQRDPAMILDEAFRREMDRRYQIMTGRPLGPISVTANPVTPLGYNRPPPNPQAGVR